MPVGDFHAHLDLGRVRMPRRICKRFRHNVIGGDLHPVWQPAGDVDIEVDGHHGAACQRSKRGAEPTLGQDRGMDAARNRAQLLGDIAEALHDVD